jgi:CRISPR/Cas system CSM-associated protein Csm4 (group 5 of RAMP superfamily)
VLEIWAKLLLSNFLPKADSENVILKSYKIYKRRGTFNYFFGNLSTGQRETANIPNDFYI